MSGNKSDQVWNPQAVTELSSLLTGQGYKNVVFLADCALISTESLLNLASQRVQFISRLPERFKLAAELKETALDLDEWEQVGQLAAASTFKPAVYRTWKTVKEIEGEKFGFVVVHSSNLEERKEKTLRKETERIQKELCRKSTELKKHQFACEADAARSGEELSKSASKAGFSSEVSVSKREEIAYGGKGRPKRGTVPEMRISWHAEVKIGGVIEAIHEKKKQLASTFVLVYQLSDDKSGGEILRQYKIKTKWNKVSSF